MTYTIGEPVQVLDKGHITLRGVTGDDWTPAKRYGSASGPAARARRRTRELINYLMAHRHETPLEMADISLVVKCSIFVARQWMSPDGQHNEISGRYVELKECFYVPEAFRGSSASNKQG
jgi:thymidylate synthase (FAD)